MDSSFAVSGPPHVRPEEYTTPMITNLATYARNMLAVHIQFCAVSTNQLYGSFMFQLSGGVMFNLNLIYLVTPSLSHATHIIRE